MFWKEKGRSPSWNSQDGGKKMKHHRDLEITRDCTAIVHTYLLCICYLLLDNILPTQQCLNHAPPSSMSGLCLIQLGASCPRHFPRAQFVCDRWFGADLLPSSTWLLVAQTHSVVVSRVHVLIGSWPETISGHRFLREATHIMVTCFLQSWGTKGTQLQVGLCVLNLKSHTFIHTFLCLLETYHENPTHS